jgi:hypothetical protein
MQVVTRSGGKIQSALLADFATTLLRPCRYARVANS